jgi:hypothetical protein
MARKPMFERPLTPAERKRRSREAAKNGVSLKGVYAIQKSAEWAQQSPRALYYYKYIMDNSECVELWKPFFGPPVNMGIRTVAEMVKLLPTSEQMDLIDIIKSEGKAVALRVWRKVKEES